MLRTLGAACLVVVTFVGCAVDPFGATPTRQVVAPDPVDVRWHDFRIHLDSTVLLWGNEATIDVRAVITDALARIEGKLRGSPAEIDVQAGSYRTIPDVGIGGFTNTTTAAVHITMDQRSPLGLTSLLKVWLPLSLTHELHHSKRILDGPGYGTTLLDAMITEGGAESFVRDVYPSRPRIPWVQPLSAAEERRVWNLARGMLTKADTLDLHETWFYGRNGLPRWAGYKLGFAIVEAYRARHPGVTGADLATMGAEQILAGSHYRPPR